MKGALFGANVAAFLYQLSYLLVNHHALFPWGSVR